MSDQQFLEERTSVYRRFVKASAIGVISSAVILLLMLLLLV